MRVLAHIANSYRMSNMRMATHIGRPEDSHAYGIWLDFDFKFTLQ